MEKLQFIDLFFSEIKSIIPDVIIIINGELGGERIKKIKGKLTHFINVINEI